MAHLVDEPDPVVLAVRFAPRHGWRTSDRPRRTAAALALPLAALVCLLAVSGNDTDGVPQWLMWSWLLLGPTTFYSLARVLRPEPRSAERTPRHLLASAGAAFAVPTLASMVLARPSDDLDVFILFGVPAILLGGTTLAWGAAAWMFRAAELGRRTG